MKEDLEINDSEFVSILSDLIDEKFDKKIRSVNIPKNWSGVVKSVDSDYATIQLAGTSTNLTPKLNKTGQTLSVNDEVFLYSPTGELSNSYIDIKKLGSASGGTSGTGSSTFTGLTDTPDSYYGQGGKVVKVNSDGTGLEFGNVSAGSGDMTKSIYDPTNKNSNAFNMDNMDEGTTNKIMTIGEKTKLSGIATGAQVNNISDVNAIDLTDGGASSLHYHNSDRNRANHTGTQTSNTISDFQSTVDSNLNVGKAITHINDMINPHNVTAEQINCLSKTNSIEYNPTEDFHPATVKFVNERIGTGDYGLNYIDGGNASSIFSQTQLVDGGGA